MVVENEIEVFGESAGNGEYVGGLTVTQLNGRGSHVVNNFVGCSESNALAGGYQYINVTAGPTQADAHVVVSNNILHGPGFPASVAGLGLVLDVGGGGAVLSAQVGGNEITGIATGHYYAAGVTVSAPAPQAELDTHEALTGASTHLPVGGSAGQVVTKGSGTSASWATPTPAGTTAGTFAAGDDARFARALSATKTGYVAGEYTTSAISGVALTTVSHPADSIHLTPYRPIAALTFAGMRIHTAGSGNMRLGAFNSDGPLGSPGTRLLDAGVIAAVGSGEKELTGLSQALVPGVLYWLALLADVAVTLVRYPVGGLPALEPLSLTGGTTYTTWNCPTFAYGALPANLGIGSPALVKSTIAPVIQLRVA
jgi:hypothetical protein